MAEEDEIEIPPAKCITHSSSQKKHARSNGTQLISSILCGKCEKMEPMKWLIYVQKKIESFVRCLAYGRMDMDE